jgi:CRP-like cAMP-binding protein
VAAPPFGAALYRKGEEGNTFHIIAQGRIDVFRDGQRVAQLGAGTSVGEMAYLAPSPDLRVHSADVIVAEPATTISFTPQALEPAEPVHPPPVRRGLHPCAGAAAACRPRALAHPRRIL